MSEDAEKKEDAIHRVDTVPPPPGEGDAYSAPTTVGPVNDAVIEAMRKAGVPEEFIPSSSERPSMPLSGPRPIEVNVPRMYDASEDDDDAVTMLHPSAGRVPVAPIASAPPATLPPAAVPPAAPPLTVERVFDSPRLVAFALVAMLALATVVAFLASLR